MIIEHVQRGCSPQMPPSNAERWAAVAELYKALRAQEDHQERTH